MLVLRDRKRRLWAARLTVAAAARVRDLAHLDVMALVADDGSEEERLAGSPGLTLDALFALCLPECERRGVTDRAFGRGFRGVPASAIADALRREVAAFFRVPGPKKPGGGSGRPLGPEELWLSAYRMAGETGADAREATFGELVALSEGRRRLEWAQTANLLSCLTGLGGRQIPAAKLDPTGGLAESGGANRMTVTADNLRDVAAIFLG